MSLYIQHCILGVDFKFRDSRTCSFVAILYYRPGKEKDAVRSGSWHLVLLDVNYTRGARSELVTIIFKEDWKIFLTGYLCFNCLLNSVNICFFKRLQI